MCINQIFLVTVIQLITLLLLVRNGQSLASDDPSKICNLEGGNAIIDWTIEKKEMAIYFLDLVNFTEKSLGLECQWRITSKIASQMFDLSRLVLGPNDILNITGRIPNNNETITFYSSKNKIIPGVLSADTFNEINVTLTLKKSGKFTKRTFEIIYLVNYPVIPLMKDSGVYTFPLNQETNATIDLDFSFQPSSQYSERKIMLKFESIPSISFTMDNNTYSVNDSVPSIYFSKKDLIEFKVSSYHVKSDKPIVIRYWLVNDDCSGEYSINNKTNGTILYPNEKIRQDQSLGNMVCAQLFTGDQGNFQLWIDEKMNYLPNVGDSISFFTLPDITNIATLQNSNLFNYKNVYTFLETKNLLVIYNSPFVDSNQKANIPNIYISTTKNITYRLKDPKSFTVSKGENIKLIYNIYSESNKNLIVNFDSVDCSGMKIAIYKTDSISDSIKPLALFDNFNVLPSAIATNSAIMRIELWGNMKNDLIFTVRHAVDSDIAPVSTDVSTLHIETNQTLNCSWFIPPSNSYTILNPSYLNLPDGSITFWELSSASKLLFNKTGPIEESFLPDFYLNSSMAYLLEVKTRSSKDYANIAISIKADLLNLNQTLDDNLQNFIMESFNYPGNYPIGFKQNWIIANKNSNSTQALITIDDLHLSGKHTLAISSVKITKVYNRDTKLERTPDLITPITMAALFDTTESDLFSRSDRGFRINITYFDCGGTIDLENNKSQTLKFLQSNDSHIDYPLCIWKVVGSKNDKTFNETVIDFKVELASSLKDSKATLNIYDVISLRNADHFALCNHTSGECIDDNVKNGSYKGSIDQAIIIYNFTNSLNTKSNYSITITVKSMPCPKTFYNLTSCLREERCITDLMACNGRNDCGDWSDEIYCNGTIIPIPPNVPRSSGGVNIWVVIFVLMPMGAILGILGYIYLPRILTNFRHGRYSEFRSDLSEVS